MDKYKSLDLAPQLTENASEIADQFRIIMEDAKELNDKDKVNLLTQMMMQISGELNRTVHNL